MVRIWQDDIDGTPAVETLVFPYRGDWYEIDLSAANFARYEAAMEDFISCARKTAVEMVSSPVAATLTSPAPVALTPAPVAPVAVVPPAPADVPAPAPVTSVSPAPAPDPAPAVVTEQPEAETVAAAPADASEPSAPGFTSDDGAPAPFARLVFEPEPEKIPVLAGVSVEAAAASHSTNGRGPGAKFSKTKGSIPRPQRLDPEQCQVIREWAKTQPRFKHAKTHGRIPTEMYEAFVLAHSEGRR